MFQHHSTAHNRNRQKERLFAILRKKITYRNFQVLSFQVICRFSIYTPPLPQVSTPADLRKLLLPYMLLYIVGFRLVKER